jgi:hypothetical protein
MHVEDERINPTKTEPVWNSGVCNIKPVGDIFPKTIKKL